MSDPVNLTDGELRRELKKFGFDAGPVSESTRAVLQNKLGKLRRSSVASESTRAVLQKKLEKLRRSSVASDLPPQRKEENEIIKSSGDQASNFSLPQRQKANKSLKGFLKSPEDRPSNLPPKRQEATGSLNEVITRFGDQSSKSSLPQRQEANNSWNDILNRSEDRTLSQIERQNLALRRKTLVPTRSSSVLPLRQEATDLPNDLINRSRAQPSNFSMPSRFAYVRHESERGKYGTPGGRLSPTRNIPEIPEISNDIPKWLVMIFGSFALVLALAYFFTAHPDTVAQTNRFVVESAAAIFDHAILPVFLLGAVIGITFLIYTAYKKYKHAGEEIERATMELVDKIAGRVQFADENGIAEQHLRDTFMPPTRRTAKDMELWNKAVSFINKLDSRMRSERRVISGVECDVWIWATSHDTSL